MKNKRTFFLLLAAICGLTYFSCKEGTVPENLDIVKGFNYYPLEVGKYVIYELDSITYTPISGTTCMFNQDTNSYFLKEEIVDVFEDNVGDKNYVIERFTRQSEDDPWEVIDVWNTKMTETQVQRVEENLRFIKIVFPVSKGASWNGNSFFFLDTNIVISGETIDFYKHWDSEYEYGSVDVPEEINGIQFDSVMTVVQSDSSDNKINHRFSVEKYARNVGLVYKEMLILDSQCCEFNSLAPCDSIPWVEKAEKGLVLRQRVLEYN